MQLLLVAVHDLLGVGFDFIADGLAVVEAGGYVRLYYGSRHDTRLMSLTLAEGFVPASAIMGAPVIGSSPGADILVQDNAVSDRAYVFSSLDGALRCASIGPTGLPGLTNTPGTDVGYLYGVTAMEIFERGGTDIVAIAQRNQPGFRLFSVNESGAFTYLSTLIDGAKTYFADVADIAAVEVGGRSFLLIASATEDGVSLFEIDTGGNASFVDAIGTDHGLSIAGPSAMQTALIGGIQFVVLASTVSSSLTVLRVNDMGVFFVEDHVIDDRNSRFEHLAALDMFSNAGRVFVVAAGTDAGVSVLELLPDGQLSMVISHSLETGAGIAPVTGIQTVVLGTSVAILLTDAGGDSIHQFAIPLTSIGDLILANGGLVTGTARDDRIIGSVAAETLQGGFGNDFLHDGGGADFLSGGAEADVFVFDRDGSADRIEDFQAGQDRIDVSAWGRIYSASALTISATTTGAIINYGDEQLIIVNANSGALSLTDADFLF